MNRAVISMKIQTSFNWLTSEFHCLLENQNAPIFWIIPQKEKGWKGPKQSTGLLLWWPRPNPLNHHCHLLGLHYQETRVKSQRQAPKPGTPVRDAGDLTPY